MWGSFQCAKCVCAEDIFHVTANTMLLWQLEVDPTICYTTMEEMKKKKSWEAGCTQSNTNTKLLLALPTRSSVMFYMIWKKSEDTLQIYEVSSCCISIILCTALRPFEKGKKKRKTTCFFCSFYTSFLPDWICVINNHILKEGIY